MPTNPQVARLIAAHPNDAFAVEESRRQGGRRDREGSRAARWVDGLWELERLATRLGRLPRSTDDRDQLRAFEWLRRQRRRESRLTVFQWRRLELIVGFEWDPLEARWTERLDALVRFETKRGRVPTRSATGAAEVGLARWRKRLLSQLAAGDLPYSRFVVLRAAITPRLESVDAELITAVGPRGQN